MLQCTSDAYTITNTSWYDSVNDIVTGIISPVQLTDDNTTYSCEVTVLNATKTFTTTFHSISL